MHASGMCKIFINTLLEPSYRSRIKINWTAGISTIMFSFSLNAETLFKWGCKSPLFHVEEYVLIELLAVVVLPTETRFDSQAFVGFIAVLRPVSQADLQGKKLSITHMLNVLFISVLVLILLTVRWWDFYDYISFNTAWHWALKDWRQIATAPETDRKGERERGSGCI